MDFLSESEHAQLQELRLTDSFVDKTLRQLDQILASRKFERVQQHAKDFLGFVVAKKLLGHSDEIKETTIAVHVYREPADFNPAETSKIRVAAADLRQRIAEFYADEGQNDPIEIIIPLETYVPEIRDRPISVAVSLFENWHPKGDHNHLCGVLSDEIAYGLNQTSWVRAQRVATVEAGTNRRYSLRGSLESNADNVRLNVCLADLHAGSIVFSQNYEEPRDNVLKLARQIANDILRALQPKAKIAPPVSSKPRKRRSDAA